MATAGRTTVLRATIDQIEALIVEKDRLLTERQALLNEKDVLAEELQHRVRNNLQLVSGMLRQQIDLNDGGPKDGRRSIAQRVMSLAKIYDHLLGNGLSRTIDFDQYVRSLCESLSAFQGDREFQVTLTCEGEAEPLLLDLDSVTALGIIIAEIVSNAYISPRLISAAGSDRAALPRAGAKDFGALSVRHFHLGMAEELPIVPHPLDKRLALCKPDRVGLTTLPNRRLSDATHHEGTAAMTKTSSPHRNAAEGAGLAKRFSKRRGFLCLAAAVASLSLGGPALAIEAQYVCSGGERLTARFSPPSAALGSVRLTFKPGPKLTLPQVMSADGGRYAGNGVEFWIKGQSATLTRNGGSETCSVQ